MADRNDGHSRLYCDSLIKGFSITVLFTPINH